MAGPYAQQIQSVKDGLRVVESRHTIEALSAHGELTQRAVPFYS
jgi:hypothetical protein